MCPACLAIGALSAGSCAETTAEIIGELGLPLVTMRYGVWALECLSVQKPEAFQLWMAERAKRENP
jgi:hypothetical protein